MKDHAFNDGLGKKLRSAAEIPQKTARKTRIAAAGLIALVAVGVALTARYWIGT